MAWEMQSDVLNDFFLKIRSTRFTASASNNNESEYIDGSWRSNL